MTHQASFLSIAHQKQLRCEQFLLEMDRIIPWNQFLSVIEPYTPQQEVGRKRKENSMMLKIYFLQQWYDLSDPSMEEAIYDRNSFQKFLGMDLLADSVPDETTILNFRHLLEEHKLQEKFLSIVNTLFEQRGIAIRQGTIMDATIIAAPPSTKNKDKKRDPEMSSTKKGNQWHFGMKAHIGTNTKGFVHTVISTKASVHDKKMVDRLSQGEKNALFGDKAYGDKKGKKKARAQGIFYGISDKGSRNHPSSSSQRKRNKKLSSVRSFVEHPFQVIKCQWHHRSVRYRGICKNHLQFTCLFALCNLFRARKTLLAFA
jgi:IS5 family transposase